MKLVALLVVAWLALILVIAAPARGDTTNALNGDQRRAQRAINDVWPEAHQADAVAVAWCESRLYRWAENGQYLGLFQMGRWERRTYGHGRGGYAQARAALRYFRASGSDWSPWSCRHAAA